MKVKLTRPNADRSLHFKVSNESGQSISFDSSADGYETQAPRPMEVVLMSAVSCSSIDTVLILKKMKQDLQDIEVEISGERPVEGDVKPFEKIHLDFKLFGNIELAKAQRAVSLSVEKYCSVLEMLKSTASVSHSLEIIKS